MNRPTVPGRTGTTPTAPAAVLAAVLVLGLVTVLAWAAAPIAGAHGDEATATLVSATPSGTSSVITVKLTYSNDGEPVTDATVTVAGDNGSGATLTPVTMQPGPAAGEFTATVAFPAPGTWNLRVTSVAPATTLTLTQSIAADPQVTIEGAGGAAGSSTTASSTASASTTTVDSGVPEINAGRTGDDDSGGTSPVWWIVGGVVVVVAVGLGVLFVARGRDQGPID